MLKINNTVKNSAHCRKNINFKSSIKATEFLKEGFEYAKKLNTKPSPEFCELYAVRNFAKGLFDILNDGKSHLVEIAQSVKKSAYALYYDVLINNQKVIIDGRCLGATPSNTGSNAMEAVIQLTRKPFNLTSHYEKLSAGIEKKPLPFIDNTPKKPVKYNKEDNTHLLSELENIIFKG